MFRCISGAKCQRVLDLFIAYHSQMKGQCLPKRNHSASKGIMLLSVQSEADWKILHEYPSLVNVSVPKLPLQIPPECAKRHRKNPQHF